MNDEIDTLNAAATTIISTENRQQHQSSSSSSALQNIDADAAFDDKETESEVHVSLSSSDKPKKHDEKAKRESKGKSHIDFNTFNAAGPSDNAVSPNFEIGGKYSFVDPFQYPDDSNMPALEDIVYSDNKEDVGAEADFSNLERSITVSPIPTTRVHKDHPVTQIIGNFLQLIRQGEEGIDYEEIFAPVTRIEDIRLFLAYASFMGFMVYQMDVKSAFLYETIKEEVYVCQPSGFEDPDYLDKVYKMVKALYGLHQAPRACQDKYVARILRKFGLTDGKLASTSIDTEKPLLKDPDIKDVDVHIYRLMIGSLMYLTLSRPNIMFAVCVCARFQVTPKVSHLHAVKRSFRYLKGKPHLGLWYPKDSSFNLVAYSDSDYAGASLYRKSTTRGCQFLGCRLISMKCKKQTVVATSSTKAKYVAAASYCAQYQVDEKDGNEVTDVDLQLVLSGLLLLPSMDVPHSHNYVVYKCEEDCWNEFSSSMASAVICLATGKRFNFSKYIFDSLARNVESPLKFLMYPRYLQVMINAQVDALSSHNTKYTSPALTQKVFANIRRICKGFSRVKTPLFDAMLLQQQVQAKVDDVEEDEDDNEVPAAPTPPSPTPATTSPPQQEPIPSPPKSQSAQPSSPPQ
nr:uncharacterized mitochondrial protein AtMg00810-like [Tanacetum cinerariifolium]